MDETVLGYEQNMVDATTAESLQDLADYPNARKVVLVPSAAVRVREDRVAPTAALGMPVPAGQAVELIGDLAGIKVISQAGTAVLDMTYYA